jgi:hypothetical protein
MKVRKDGVVEDQPITAASLPLPSGASTAANQTTIIGHVDGIEGLLTTIDADTSTLAAVDFATQTTLAAINAKLVTGTVIGDVNAIQSGTWNINNISGTITLPTGASTAANQSTIIGHVDGIEALLTTIDADTSTLAAVDYATQTTLAAINAKLVTGTVIGDVNAIQSGTWNINNISGSITLPTGAATAANQSTIIGHVDGIEALLTTIDADTSTIAGAVSGSEMQVDVVTMPEVTTAEKKSSTGTHSNTTSSASNQTLLASNANRLGATVFNDADKDLYLKLGATASTSSFTIKVATDGYYEVPYGYTGIIDGLWDTSPTGSARVVEFTA